MKPAIFESDKEEVTSGMLFMETDNLILKKAEYKDWEAMYRNVWSHPETAKFMAWRTAVSEEEARARIQRTIKYQETNDSYLVYTKKNREAIGFAGVEEMEPHVFQEKGIALGPDFVGKGYGKEILKVLLRYCEALGGKMFYYHTRAENTVSRALALSCGFVYCDSKEETDIRNGERYELLIYSKKIGI